MRGSQVGYTPKRRLPRVQPDCHSMGSRIWDVRKTSLEQGIERTTITLFCLAIP